MAGIYEGAYFPGENPRTQSGFGGDEARWEAGRRVIVEAIDRDGSFTRCRSLDVGCASGLLLESVVSWSPHRVAPFGLELAPRLAELARTRLPRWADRIFVGNALTWEPPRRSTSSAPSWSTCRTGVVPNTSAGSWRPSSHRAGA